MATLSNLGTSFDDASGVLKVSEHEDATAVQQSAPAGASQSESGIGAGGES